jgi:hypothetical protein
LPPPEQGGRPGEAARRGIDNRGDGAAGTAGDEAGSARLRHPRIERKLFSLFEPSTDVIRKGKTGKPKEFGKLIKLLEAENQIVVDYEDYDRPPTTPTC